MKRTLIVINTITFITDQIYTDRELAGNHVPTFNAHARCSGKCNAHFLLGKR